MGNIGSERLKTVNYYKMNECMNYKSKIISKHYINISFDWVFLLELSCNFYIKKIVGTHRILEIECYYLRKTTMSYIHSIHTNLLSNCCLQIIFLCGQNILVNKMNLQFLWWWKRQQWYHHHRKNNSFIIFDMWQAIL